MNAEMQKEVNADPNPKPEIRFVYFGRLEKLGINSKNEEYIQHVHFGVTCVGYQITDEGRLDLAVSFCSPTDEFSKKKARMIIKGRLAGGKVQTVPSLTEVKEKAFADMSYEELITGIRNVLNSIDGDSFAGVQLPLWYKGV